jgi:branched-chain amino acid transport system permease protein
VALLIAPVAAAAVGVLAERFLLRKVHAFGHIGELILTIGISLVILDGVKAFWGTENLPLPIPDILQGLVRIGGLEYPAYRLFVIGLALCVLVFLSLILYKTRLGMVVRAAVSDAGMVNSLGINVPLVFMLVFGVGTWMAGIAGVAIAPILTVFPGLADQMGLDAFIVVVVGGFGSLAGAFIVSIVCGLLNAYGVQFISSLAPVLMFIFMAVVLTIKPMGIFGERE